MGTTTSIVTTSPIFVQTVQDHNFGAVRIYRTDEGRFLMQTKHTHIYKEKREVDFQNMLSFAGTAPPNVVPIIQLKHYDEHQLCIHYVLSEIYFEYYNYTFLDILKNSKELQEGELWYVLKTLLELLFRFKAHSFGFQFAPDSIYLNLKGVLCVYPLHLLAIEEYTMTTDTTMLQDVGRIVLQLATMQLLSLVKDEQEELSLLRILNKKNNLLGRIVKQMMGRERNEEDILQEIEKLFQVKKIPISTQIRVNKFKYESSDLLPEIPSPTYKFQLPKLEKKNKDLHFKTETPEMRNFSVLTEERKQMLESKSNAEKNLASLDLKKLQNKKQQQKLLQRQKSIQENKENKENTQPSSKGNSCRKEVARKSFQQQGLRISIKK